MLNVFNHAAWQQAADLVATDDKLRLQNEFIALTVAPSFGARITELIDRSTGRQWLVPGSLDVEADEHAVYGRDQASGWDECFPTVAPCDATATAWGSKLRDHGELWGRAWGCEAREHSVLANYSTERYRFHRRLTLEGPRLRLAYELENLSAVPMPWLWSQHCLLQTVPGDSIALIGMGACSPTYLSYPGLQQGQRLTAAEFTWPILADVPFGLDTVKGVDTQFAMKAYAPVHSSFSALIGDSRSQWRMDFDGNEVPFVGLWIAYGGWPDSPGVHQLAIEPTNAPADDLASAMGAGHSVSLAAHSTRRWSVTMTLSSSNTSVSATEPENDEIVPPTQNP